MAISDNTASLRNVLNAVNDLPAAGSGGGTPVVFTYDGETCTCNKTYSECLADYENMQFAAYLMDTTAGFFVPVAAFTSMEDMYALAYVFSLPETLGGSATAVVMTPDGIVVEAQ